MHGVRKSGRYAVVVLTLLCVIGLVAAAAQAQVGGGKTGDPRIKKLLDDSDYKYEITSTGNFKLTMRVGDSDRTQVIIINSDTEKYRGFEIREIWSPGYKPDGKIGRDEAIKMLLDTYQRKLGGWQLLDTGEKQVAVFAAKVAAELSADDLTTVMKIVLESADEMEKDLTDGKDDL